MKFLVGIIHVLAIMALFFTVITAWGTKSSVAILFGLLFGLLFAIWNKLRISA
jgi:hypothetical protein